MDVTSLAHVHKALTLSKWQLPQPCVFCCRIQSWLWRLLRIFVIQPLLRYCWLKLACLKYCNNQSIQVCKFSWWEHVSFSDRVGIGLPKLTGNARSQKSPKIRHMGTITQLCRAISLQLRHVSIIRKKRLKQQYLHHMSLQYGELRPTSG